MPAKIYPRRRRKVYLAEWRQAKGLSQKQLADRLESDVMTVSRWELGKTAISTDALAALAEALGGDMMEPEDLYHHPGEPTPNQLLRDQPPEVVENAMRMLRAIRR
ncbi:helix-turn-helix transcriptional regulator [Bradyrhizobium sp. 62]|nr:helix-turn-helix transcriptional regulator [Bradyrhizobium sp. 62]